MEKCINYKSKKREEEGGMKQGKRKRMTRGGEDRCREVGSHEW